MEIWGLHQDDLPREDRLPDAFEAIIVVIEEEPQIEEEIRRRADELLAAPMDNRTFRRHMNRAIETGCAEYTATGLRLPSDTLSTDERARDTILNSTTLMENGYVPEDI